MLLNSYVHEQLAEAHRRDLLETAQHYRLVTQAPQRYGARSFRFTLPGRGPRRHAGLEPCLSTSSTSMATR